MRYILIDPYAKSVTEGDDPAMDGGKSYAPMYAVMQCLRIEFHDLGIRPRHAILMDETGGMKRPMPPSFLMGNMQPIGRCLIVGMNPKTWKACTLPVERVAKAVQFENVPPRELRQPRITLFKGLDELRRIRAARPQPSWGLD